MRGRVMAKKILKQRSTNDCAVACLAMLLDESYANVRRLVDHYFARTLKKSFCGMNEDDDKAVAAALGEKAKVWYIRDKNRKAITRKLIGRRAMLCVPQNARDFHAVYWDGYKLHDPAKSPGRRGWGQDGTRAFAVAIHAVVLDKECKNCSVEVC